MPNHAKGTTSGLHTASVHVGIPPRDIRDTARTKVYCHGFANLDSQRGEMIESPVFHCLGIEWILQIYARGHNHEGEVDVISVAAIRRSSSKIRTHVEYKLANKREVKFGWDAICGHSIPRCTGLVNLVQGALVVEVRMWPEINPSYFIPDNPSACKTVQALFTDEESADVVFEVGMDPTKNEPTSQSEINTSCIKFSAHYNILKVAAPQLADFVKK